MIKKPQTVHNNQTSQNLSLILILILEHIFRKQKRTAVYGCAFLVSDFKLIQENDAQVY